MSARQEMICSFFGPIDVKMGQLSLTIGEPTVSRWDLDVANMCPFFATRLEVLDFLMSIVNVLVL